jgi:shikimate kinase
MDNIFLTGFMATGKTIVGAELAARLSRPFVDTDADIVRVAGMSIAEIFRRRGEAEFRELEREAVAQACRRRGVVVATGGGAIVDRRSRDRMREAGRIVCLTASPDAVLHRLGDEVERPLLAGCTDRARRIRELLTERAEAYGAVDCTIDTTGLKPAEVVGAILAWMDAGSTREVLSREE